MITNKFVQNSLGQTSYRNLLCEIAESQRWGYKYMSIKLIDSGAGFKYRTQYSAVSCEGFVGIEEWLTTG